METLPQAGSVLGGPAPETTWLTAVLWLGAEWHLCQGGATAGQWAAGPETQPGHLTLFPLACAYRLCPGVESRAWAGATRTPDRVVVGRLAAYLGMSCQGLSWIQELLEGKP